MLRFNELLSLHNFKSIHKVEDDEGTFEIFSNDTYDLRYYWDEDGSKIYPFFNNGNYVLQLNSKASSEDFTDWSNFFTKD